MKRTNESLGIGERCPFNVFWHSENRRWQFHIMPNNLWGNADQILLIFSNALYLLVLDINFILLYPPNIK